MRANRSKKACSTLCIVVVALISLVDEVQGSIFTVDCPPAFINFEHYFKRSLQNDDFKHIFERIKSESCIDTAECISSNSIQRFNKDRCNGNATLDTSDTTSVPSSSVAAAATSSKDTARVTSATVTLKHTTTSLSPPAAETPATEHAESRKSTEPHVKSSQFSISSKSVGALSSTAWTLIDSANQTSGVGIPATPSVREAKAMSPSENHTYIYFVIFGLVLLVVLLLFFAYYFRKKLHLNIRSSNVIAKKDRKEESCRSPSSTSNIYFSCNGQGHSDEKDEEKGKRIILVDNTVNGQRYVTLSDIRSESDSLNHINNNSIDCRESLGSMDPGGIEDFHFSTLRTIQLPHAVNPGGFGESYTDFSLPRTAQKKKKKPRKLQEEVSLQSINFIDTDSTRSIYKNLNEQNGGVPHTTPHPADAVYDTPYCKPLAERSISDAGSAVNDYKHTQVFESEVSLSTFQADENLHMDKRWSTLESPSRDSGYQSPIYRTNSQLSRQSDVFSTDSQTTLIRKSSNNSHHSYGNSAYIAGTLPRQSSASGAKPSKHAQDFRHYNDGWPSSLKRDPREKYKKKAKRDPHPEKFVYKDNHYDL